MSNDKNNSNNQCAFYRQAAEAGKQANNKHQINIWARLLLHTNTIIFIIIVIHLERFLLILSAMLKICKINACPNGTLGLHLSRAPWDPYPWVSGIQEGSSAEEAGMRVGDTVLEFNGNDVLGQKILEIANRIRAHWQSGATDVTVVIWRNETELDNDCSDGGYEDEEQEDNGTIAEEQRKQRVQRSHQQHSSINQQSLQKFATCLQHIAQLLECPVCLE
ncbi:unnamed protein product, partial [Ceratitis capitata]